MAHRQGGFTITEVMMFLAVSGLLLVAALAGVSTNINNTRFNDTVRSVTSYLQGQYDEVANGLNDRESNVSCDASAAINTSGSTAPGMTNCVVLGRFIKIEGDSFTSRYIIGYSTLPFAELPENDVQALSDAAMVIRVANDTEGPAGSFDVPWSIAMSGWRKGATPSSQPLGLAIIRSPVSGNIMYFMFPVTSGDAAPAIKTSLVSANVNKQTSICFEEGGRHGAVVFDAGKGQDVIATDLTAAAGGCS